ncbi:hypothetical protein [Rubellicoccus peritrichatus]|uniref:hypothetical protein n=1 Tax=Rubellicoccus peritrichatus TaxID=3080537 RepID=UPI0031F31C09
MRAQDIDVCNGTLIFETLKQREALSMRALPVPSELLELLMSIIDENALSPKDRVWTFCRETGWRYIRNLNEQAGIKGNPTGMRHGFGVACAVKRNSVAHNSILDGTQED